MKILMISPQYKPIVGGYERAAERLSVALVERGHSVTVASERRSLAWARREMENGVEVRRWFCVYRPTLHILSSLLALAWFLLRRGRGFEVWHVHQYGPHAALTVAMAKVLRRPVVLKLTSSGRQGINRTLSQGRFPGLVSYLHKKVSAIVALTRETAAEAEAFGIPASRIAVLGNGVDTQTYRPRSAAERLALRRELGLVAPHCLISVGRLATAKNVAGLLTAWSLAAPRLGDGWQLVIVGDGPLRSPLLEQFAATGLSDSVRWVGYQSNISDWMGAADAYVMASDLEGLSNTMLEAMATGLAVLTTQVSGTVELVAEPGCGFVVPVGDMAGLAEAMVTCAADPRKRVSMGQSGRALIEKRFTISSIASAYEILYIDMTLDRLV
jgi:glycosyltransferase involved in cell wall biosynthesis